MSQQLTLPDIPNAIFSPESESGHSLCVGQDGRMIDRSGLDHVRVNPSRLLVSKKDLKTNGTSGQLGTGSSRSCALQSFLVNRLTQRLSTDGSILFRQTWKTVVTPLGRHVFRLVVSARRTSDNGSTLLRSWKTPQAMDANGKGRAGRLKKGSRNPDTPGSYRSDLKDRALFAGWPTTTRDYKGGYPGGRIRQGKFSTDTLDVTAQLASWATPRANASCERLGETGSSIAGHQERLANAGSGYATDEDYGLRQFADWLLCRDGFWRPVEPGTFPLVDGDTSRVGRLRAYGNAIDAGAAETFIAAFLESRL